MRRHLCAGTYGSRHMGCMGGPARQLAIHTFGGLQITVTPQSVNTFGVQRLVGLHYCIIVGCAPNYVPASIAPGRGHYLDLGVTAVAVACSLCHDHVFPSFPDFDSAPRAQAASEHRWRHIEHLPYECVCIPGLDSSVALTLVRDDLFRVCSGSDHAEAVLLAMFPTSRVPVVAAKACVAPFLLDPAAALGRMSPWQ